MEESDVGQQRLYAVKSGGDDAPDAEALLSRVARGDSAAFEALYDVLAGPVYGIVLRVLRDPAQAEEVAQEVLVEVWRQAPRFSPEVGSARAWALTIARRRAVDRVRSAQAAADREVRAASADATPEYDETADAVEVRLEQEAVRRCLEGLTTVQRQAVDLAYYSGYTHTEVASVLEVPLGTVKTRLRDGLIRLRDCLGVAS